MTSAIHAMRVGELKEALRARGVDDRTLRSFTEKKDLQEALLA